MSKVKGIVKPKPEIILRLVVDTREQKLEYIKSALTSRHDKENIVLKDYVFKGLKTEDISFEWSLDRENWHETSFAIEIKKGMDLFQTLWSHKARFKEELERAKELEEFTIVHDYTYTDIQNEIRLNTLKGLIKFQYAQEGFTNAYFTLCRTHTVICTGTEEKALGACIRRLVKEYFKKNKNRLLKEIEDDTKCETSKRINGRRVRKKNTGV